MDDLVWMLMRLPGRAEERTDSASDHRTTCRGGID